MNAQLSRKFALRLFSYTMRDLMAELAGETADVQHLQHTVAFINANVELRPLLAARTRLLSQCLTRLSGE